MRSKYTFVLSGILVVLCAGSGMAQTINKPSIQFFLQVHKG